MPTPSRTKVSALVWTLFSLSTLIGASLLAWQLLRSQNFLYPVWHDVAGIKETIARYGPENRYRDRFAETTKAERVRLFEGIVHAIHHRGEGLAQLTYHDPQGNAIDRLLRRAEIIHLQDVAKLVDTYLITGWWALGLALFILLLASQKGLALPSLLKLSAMVAGFFGVVAMIVLVIGPVDVFYQLHEWIFPDDHEWFFYYQDSLMTLMMKAPDLFGYIAACWVVLTLLCFFVLVTGGRWLNQRMLNWSSPAPNSSAD